MSIDAMKAALEALQDARRYGAGDWSNLEEILRLAIEQAEKQKPVAWVRWDDEENYYDVRRTPPTQENIDYLAKWNRPAWVPAYPHPPQQEKQEPVAWWDGRKKFVSPKEKDWDKRTGGTLSFGCDTPLYTAPPQRQPLTEEMVIRAARQLCKIHSVECQVDEQDAWSVYGDTFISDARAALEAAHGIGGEA